MINIKKYIKTSSADITNFVVVLVFLILTNVVSQFVFFRLDLTAEKRYTLSDDTKEILEGLEEEVFIRVYLEGDLNIPFSKFKTRINDLLDELKVYGGRKIQYEFVNPFEEATEEERKKILEDLYSKGLKPTNIHQKDDEGGVSEKIIFPSALLYYKGIEIPINLLQNNPGLGAEQNLNNSIEAIEFSIVSVIKNVTDQQLKKIAFLEGHGELNEFETGDISKELSKSFQIDRGEITNNAKILDGYEVVIIAKPTKAFSEKEKLVLDQYIMKGGRVLWLVDKVKASLDSLVNGQMLATAHDYNISDMLFKYGVRINNVLVQDIQCNIIPVNMALEGNSPDFKPAPWLYHPLLIPNNEDPITKNINMNLGRFVNNIDMIEAREKVKKRILLHTSHMSRTVQVPMIINLGDVAKAPPKEQFTKNKLAVGVLLEGEFESVFMNRRLNFRLDSLTKTLDKSKKTKMAVIADGDLIKNDVRYTANGPLVSPLGYDRFTRRNFGNKEFLVNLIHYLADDNNLLSLRGREFKLRLLDKNKIRSERNKWILINTVLPSILIIALGIAFVLYRRYRFTKLINR